MGTFSADQFKALQEPAKKHQDQEMLSQIITLREEMLELREENLNLKQQVKQLEQEKDISSNLRRKGNVSQPSHSGIKKRLD